MEVAETEAVRPTEVAEAALEEDPEATEAADPTTEVSRRSLSYFIHVKTKKIIKKTLGCMAVNKYIYIYKSKQYFLNALMVFTVFSCLFVKNIEIKVY